MLMALDGPQQDVLLIVKMCTRAWKERAVTFAGTIQLVCGFTVLIKLEKVMWPLAVRNALRYDESIKTNLYSI